MERNTGVLLLNLGGPETLDDVRPFLYNLFSDPDIIRLPVRFLQKPLAWLIAGSRYKKSQGYYRAIGGGSPLRRVTEEQADALAAALHSRGHDIKVFVAMRYWHPFTEEALDRILAEGVSDIIVLPLYPQYSISTTGSSLNRLREVISKSRAAQLSLKLIESWYSNKGYISSLMSMVREELAKMPDKSTEATHILFSAHSIPVSYIDKGDPYLDQTRETVNLIMKDLSTSIAHSLSFQSKVGPVKWLGPSTDQTIRKLAGEGVRQLLIVPVSFVSEHVETLYELDIQYRKLAEELGITCYRRVPALNCRDDFIEALAGLVLSALKNGCTENISGIQ